MRFSENHLFRYTRAPVPVGTPSLSIVTALSATIILWPVDLTTSTVIFVARATPVTVSPLVDRLAVPLGRETPSLVLVRASVVSSRSEGRLKKHHENNAQNAHPHFSPENPGMHS